MNKVYIDLGCFDGDTILKFYKDHDPEDWQIFGFDPNYRFISQWQSIVVKYPHCEIDTGIAWTKDIIIPFTLRPEDAPYGSTAIQDKVDWGQGEIIETHAFDFSQWLKQFDGYEEVIIKMDVEGSEFDLLEKMIDDGTITIPTAIHIEWHDTKMGQASPLYTERKEKIINYLNEHNITWHRWVDR